MQREAQAHISRLRAGSMPLMLFRMTQKKITTFCLTILNFQIAAESFLSVSFSETLSHRVPELHVRLYNSYEFTKVYFVCACGY